MRIDEIIFQDKNGNEINPSKEQLSIYIKSLHSSIKDKDVKIEEYERIIKKFCDENAFLSLEEASLFLPEYKVGEEVFVKDPMTSEIITGKIIVVYSEHTIYEMPSFTYEVKFDDETDIYKQDDIIAKVENE